MPSLFGLKEGAVTMLKHLIKRVFRVILLMIIIPEPEERVEQYPYEASLCKGFDLGTSNRTTRKLQQKQSAH